MKKIVLLLALGIMSLSYEASAQTTPAPAAVADTVALKEYVGKYKFEGLPFEYITFAMQNGVLNIQAGDQGGPMKQDPTTPEKFEAADGQAKILFVRNEEKKLVKVTIDYQGMLLEGKKED